MSVRSIVLGSNASNTPSVIATSYNAAVSTNINLSTRGFNLPAPSNPEITTGCMLLAIITTNTNNVLSDFSASLGGWSSVLGGGSYPNNCVRQTFLYQRVTGPPAASYDFQMFVSGGFFPYVSGVMIAVKNANYIEWYSAKNFASLGFSTPVTAHDAPSATGPAGALHLCGFSFFQTSTVSITDPSGYTALSIGNVNNGNPTQFPTTRVISRQLTLSGATGVKTATSTVPIQSAINSLIIV